MSAFGDSLRRAREARGETIAVAAAATGIGGRLLEALERQDLDAVPATSDAAALAKRYAAHLGLDGPEIAAQVVLLRDGDPDADTQPIPVVPTRTGRDSSLLWIGAGAALGIAALVILGGGLGPGGSSPTGPPAGTPAPVSTATRPAPAAPAVRTAQDGPATSEAPVPRLQPAPGTTPAIDLRLDARPGKTVWVEVRRGDATGEQVFAGIVGGGATRRVTASAPLWLGVAWAPNVAITLNGEPLDAEGGTESYRVTARGLTLL